ncbi:hypothetical protein JCM8097_005792 [Rhodosporidiobolus ruineniae]
MATARGDRSPSVDSHNDMHDSHDEAHAGPSAEASTSSGTAAASSKGKKVPKSKAAKEADRKAQNRIAQREFRQRKQQYIKELETKVALHEMGRDEQIDRLKNAIKMVLQENQQLRTILASMGQLFGEGLGGALPKLGVALPEFNDIISRTILDTAQDALKLPLPANAASGSAVPSSVPVPASTAPAQSLENILTSVAGTSQPQDPSPPDLSFAFPSGLSGPASAPPTQHPALPDFGTFDLPTNSFPNISLDIPPSVPPHPGLSSLPSAPATLQHVAPSSAPPPVQQQPAPTAAEEAARENFINSIKGGNMERISDHVQDLFGVHSDNMQMQAMQLIGYHMKNRRDNPNYNLPPSLRLTVTQQTVPHHPFFDGIIFSSLRDRLILLKDQLTIEELISDLSRAVNIHGQDLLNPQAWEISEEFLRKYWYVIDKEVLEISNRWRTERGEPALSMRCIVPSSEKGEASSASALNSSAVLAAASSTVDAGVCTAAHDEEMAEEVATATAQEKRKEGERKASGNDYHADWFSPWPTMATSDN